MISELYFQPLEKEERPLVSGNKIRKDILLTCYCFSEQSDRPVLSLMVMEKMLSKTTLSVAAGVCGSLILGYCIYFDRKRRTDPLFKQKLKERRTRAKQQQDRAKSGNSRFPDIKDYDAVQKFFIQEVQLGEELLGQGDIENGLEHLTNAVAVCGQPHQLLQVLQQTLPPQIFNLLIQKLPAVSQRLAGSSGASVTMVEDDVE